MEMALVPVGNQSMVPSDNSVNSKVIQVTNIAPQATRDQMHTLFSFLGKIEDLRLYPSLRDASVSIQSRCCYLKFLDEGVLPISLHMTNTVFIDRAIIVQPFHSNEIPDEMAGLEFANQAARTITGENKLPPHVSNETSLDGMIYTKDMPLYQTGLPPFPPLPGHTDPKLVEEIRRTLVVLGVSKETSAQEVMQYFGNGAGEVKYFRWCTKDGVEAEKDEETNGRTCMLEFTDYGAIIPAMRLNGTDLNEKEIKVYYSTQSISKPKAKSNEDSLREIEEAMKKVKEAQSLVSATVDPLMGLLNKRSSDRSKSRERSTHDRDYYVSSMGKESRRSRSRDRYAGRRRSRSRDRYSSRRRSRSRGRRSRSRGRRSRSRESRRSKRSRSRESRRKRSRSKSKEKKVKEEKKDKDDSDKEVKKEDENGEGKETDKEKSRSRSRSKSKESREGHDPGRDQGPGLRRGPRGPGPGREAGRATGRRGQGRDRTRRRARRRGGPRARSRRRRSSETTIRRRLAMSRKRRRRTQLTWRFPTPPKRET